MATVTYPNGVVLSWDDTLQVGELITAHEAGYHIITGFEYRDGMTPLIYHARVVSDAGRKVKGTKTLKCDASYARRLTKEDIEILYRVEINAASIKKSNLMQFAIR